ncbi:hypothetical protein [Burkholderia cepacia]|uniref:hypothetical protein n=1 Tax=Burkholderia cepacia TaxID=292 RepID=UPI002AB770F0|nr:hypothetical protein [Burkholderia cepacia]
MSKSMGSYQLFAWRDAMSLASWLEESYDLRAVRAAFEALNAAERDEFEQRNAEVIEELIRRPESQRPALLRKAGKNIDPAWHGLLILFAVMSQARTREVIELRDNFRDALEPGLGNRVTCAGLYAFQRELLALPRHAWPWEVFDAYGGGADREDDDEEQDS